LGLEQGGLVQLLQLELNQVVLLQQLVLAEKTLLKFLLVEQMRRILK